ncbi:hypothetical protein KCU71_g792, partial [Aureobasidium melanogenum]
MPKYLLSHVFWTDFLTAEPTSKQPGQPKIVAAAVGFLRSYFYLIQHESDLRIAQQDELGLVPKNVTWETFCSFSDSFTAISDDEVSERYQYGELRMTRLNFWAAPLLGQMVYQDLGLQYSDYFSPYFAPLLFVFAIFSVLLSAMQVALAAEALDSKRWLAFWSVSRWFAVVRPVMDDDTGFKVLYEPELVDPKSNDIVDIVAVHGIGAHPDDTWCKLRGAGLDAADPQSYINWLSDPAMLPEVVPNARIMRYGYRSALIDAYHDTEKWQGIFQSATGLIFFGTPFRGAEGMSQSEMLQAALSEYEEEEVHTEVLRILDPGNELLQDLVDSFGKTRSLPNRAQVACFFELQPSNVGAIVGKQKKKRFVVSESSGCLDVSEATEKYSLERSHFNMNKFGKPTEEDFMTVSEVVQRMAKAAPGLLLARSSFLMHVIPRSRQAPYLFQQSIAYTLGAVRPPTLTWYIQEKHRVTFTLKGVPAIDHFVQRASDMQKLEQHFFSQQPDLTRRKMFVVHGLGGIGKTQLCVEFVRQYQEKYSAVFWLDGSSEDALQRSFIDIVARLPANEVPLGLVRAAEQASPDQRSIVRGVLDWLSLPSNRRWLLVIDNVDRDHTTKERDPLAYDVKQYLPAADHGNILVTSRLSTLTAPRNSLRLTEVNCDQGRAILEATGGENMLAQDKSSVDALLEKLSGLPLALTQAGAYIGQTAVSIVQYLEYYNSTWKDLMELQDEYPLQEYAQRSVLTTWKISYEQVKNQGEEAGNLLQLWSFLYAGDLWYELVACTKEFDTETVVPDWLEVLTQNKLAFDRALALLIKYSLVEGKTETASYAMHSVLHTWCRYLGEIETKKEAFRKLAVNIVGHMVPSESMQEYWVLQRRLLPHGQAILKAIKSETITETNVNEICAYEKLAGMFADQDQHVGADKLYKRALAGKEKALGPEHTSTLDTVHNLGLLYVDQGRLAEAEEMYERALAGCEKTLGPEHT